MLIPSVTISPTKQKIGTNSSHSTKYEMESSHPRKLEQDHHILHCLPSRRTLIVRVSSLMCKSGYPVLSTMQYRMCKIGYPVPSTTQYRANHVQMRTGFASRGVGPHMLGNRWHWVPHAWGALLLLFFRVHSGGLAVLVVLRATAAKWGWEQRATQAVTGTAELPQRAPELRRCMERKGTCRQASPALFQIPSQAPELYQPPATSDCKSRADSHTSSNRATMPSINKHPSSN